MLVNGHPIIATVVGTALIPCESNVSLIWDRVGHEAAEKWQQVCDTQVVRTNGGSPPPIRLLCTQKNGRHATNVSLAANGCQDALMYQTLGFAPHINWHPPPI